MNAKTYTVEQITTLLSTNNLAVERGILAIYKRQTADEQTSNSTLHHNNVGFSGADARTGTYLANWLLSGKHLNGKFLDKGRNIAIKYRKQLTEIANNPQ